VVYLDTGCLVKLYYPEPENPTVIAAVAGEVIVFTPLHELEMVAAMQLKIFRGEAKPEQAVAAIELVRHDLVAGKLLEARVNWPGVFSAAVRLAQDHAAAIGCRSLDILHCALATMAGTTMFLSSDKRQFALARGQGLPVRSI
jgi:predicted nucleic acid-binding protein